MEQAFKGARPGTSRPVTALGRQVRLGTASMMSQHGGPFIDVDRLDLRKYAARPSIAKALCDFLLYHDHNPRKCVGLLPAASAAARASRAHTRKMRLGTTTRAELSSLQT